MLYLLPLLLISTDFDLHPSGTAAASPLSFDLGGIHGEYQPEAQRHVQFDSQTPLHSLWGKKGSKRWGYGGGIAFDLEESDNQIKNFGIEFEFFVEDNLSLDLGFHLLKVEQTGKNASGFNATLHLRWHFIDKETWSMFIEGGVGLLRTSDDVPVDGSQFNFTPQIGGGFSFDAGNNNRWLVGVRWQHISNANMYNANPSRDSLMFWTGLSFPY
ncbi:MAG TPA: acyloxyacyl hydrolase [Phycisphaerales bacterium]|nr:acyloxyacyl hydrolase [Phycisphaerales bacterium]